MLKHSQFQHLNKSQLGFSMIEILITLVIIATALLGTAGLQLFAMKVGKSGESRIQAVFLVSDIAERMEANKLGATAGNYVVAAASAPSVAGTDCAAVSCDAPTLAAWDINQWGSAIISSGIKEPSWQIQQTGAGNPSTYVIRINWAERSTDKLQRGDTLSFTATRVVSN
jgi:type IV pilus assembly protein PilV